MFDSRSDAPSVAASGHWGRLDAPAVSDWAAGLHGIDPDLGDSDRIELLRALEDLKSAAAAAQARIAADFAASQRQEQREQGVRSRDVGKGVCAQVALARRESPHRGNMLVGLAEALVHEMPHTLAALEAGVLSEYRARIMVKETACLSRTDRTQVDAAVCSDQRRLATLGNRRLEAEAKRASYRIDPHAVVARAAHAETERSVTIRPAPDTMVWLTALLPVAQGVACYAGLRAAADSARATGSERSRGQVMADTLVERVTGRSEALGSPVTINLVMTDTSLLDNDAEPALVQGYGPVPAGVARRLVSESDQAWVRRLYTAPVSGQLVAMESRSRLFPEGLATLVALRDQICRTPWCDAPIRHIDHVFPAGEGGATSRVNGQGLCEACNYLLQVPGWRARTQWAVSRAGPHTVSTTTPTGHIYESRAPDPPGTVQRTELSPRIDWQFWGPDITLAA